MHATLWYQTYRMEHGLSPADQRLQDLHTGEMAAALRSLRLRLATWHQAGPRLATWHRPRRRLALLADRAQAGPTPGRDVIAGGPDRTPKEAA